MSVNVSFDGNSLQTANIVSNTIQHAGLPTKRAQSYALSHANASKIPFVEYPTKPISITGTLVSDNVADMDALIDTFNSYFINQDANLDIDYNGGTRRYIATATNMELDRPGNLAWANFTVTFTCSQPFGQNTTTSTALSASGRTSSNYNDNFTFVGSAPVQQVVATITLASVTDASGGHIIFGNQATGQQITIQRTWSAADVLVIDCAAKTVTVNGTAVEFSGAFPLFVPGAQTLTYLDNLTARNFSISVVYYPMYL
jgi:phage-related protein